MELAVARERLQAARRVAVLTGAGVSAASGLATFRGAGGYWQRFRAETLATPAAYARDPELVWGWYRWRFAQLCAASPNEAHRLLAELEARVPEFTLVTQNVDGLHQRAGSRRVVELHGNITLSRCERCGQLDPLQPDFAIPPSCRRCGSRARPNAVWFGEALPQAAWQQALAAFGEAEVALVVGTSARVEPAASLGRLAAAQGAYVIEINPEPTPLTPHAHLALRAEAIRGLRLLVAGAAGPAGHRRRAPPG